MPYEPTAASYLGQSVESGEEQTLLPKNKHYYEMQGHMRRRCMYAYVHVSVAYVHVCVCSIHTYMSSVHQGEDAAMKPAMKFGSSPHTCVSLRHWQ